MTTYRIYHNVQSRFDPYTPGDRLWFDAAAYEASVPDGTHDPVTTLLEVIFDRHNRDDRPDAFSAPSLSVGDIVALDWDNENATFWAVGRFGWTEVVGPYHDQVVNAPWSDHEDIGYFSAVDLVQGPW